MTHVTCRLTAKDRDELRNPTLGNRVRATFTLLHVGKWVNQWSNGKTDRHLTDAFRFLLVRGRWRDDFASYK